MAALFGSRNKNRGRHCTFVQKRSDSRKRGLWSLSTLEKRLMLAADAGAVISEAGGEAIACEIAADVTPSRVAPQSTAQLVFIDSAVDQYDHLLSGLAENHERTLVAATRSQRTGANL